jgi:ADP-heptose:LPS heptosyltransferase
LINEIGLSPVIFGGPEDRQVATRLVEGWGSGFVAAGSLDVRASAAAMEGMSGYLGNDTGTMHLAAAAGLPCIGLFAATDLPGRWTPYGGAHVELRTKPPCEGCRLSVCPYGNRCLNEITDEDIRRALRTVLEA